MVELRLSPSVEGRLTALARRRGADAGVVAAGLIEAGLASMQGEAGAEGDADAAKTAATVAAFARVDAEHGSLADDFPGA